MLELWQWLRRGVAGEGKVVGQDGWRLRGGLDGFLPGQGSAAFCADGLALAAYAHHSALRRQKMARAGGWENEQYYTATFPSIPPPRRQALSTFPLTSKMCPAAVSRPDRLAGVRPQKQVQRHIVDQIADAVPGLPTLDVPVPLMVEQLVDMLQFFDALSLVAEQVTDVPKIIIERPSPRTSVREPQLAEQLVEVPTILYFLKEPMAKQIVEIPVPGGGGRLAGLQGFLLGQS